MNWLVWVIIGGWFLCGVIGRVITRCLDTLIFSLDVYFPGDYERNRRTNEIREDICGVFCGFFYLIAVIITVCIEKRESN